MLEFIAVVGTVVLVGVLSPAGFGRSIFAPISTGKSATPQPTTNARTVTVGGSIEESPSGPHGFLKNLDCSKLTVAAFKAPASLQSIKSLDASPLVAQTAAMPGPSAASCVYSMKVPVGESLTISVSSVNVESALTHKSLKAGDSVAQVPGGTGTQTNLKWKGEIASVHVPGGSAQKIASDSLSAKTASWIKGERTPFKATSSDTQTVPLVIDLSESP